MHQFKDSKVDIVPSWVAQLSDGTIVSETEGVSWAAIKEKVASLVLVTKDGKTISLPQGMSSYVQGKTASCALTGGEAKIESRWIGFVDGGRKTVVRVSDASGDINIEVS